MVNLVHLIEEAIFLYHGVLELELRARVIEICIMSCETLLNIVLADETQCENARCEDVERAIVQST